MKDIKAIKGKFYIRGLIDEGEHEHQDFKYAISDARKIARSISAFANNDGGRLLVGVKDNGSIVGIPNEEDIYMIEHAAETYCNPPQEVEMTAFVADGGAVVLRATIMRADSRPVYCIEEGNRHVAYYRVKDENLVAHPLMVEAWKLSADNNRFSTGALTEDDLSLLRHLEKTGETTPEAYMVSCHRSQRTSRDTIVRLLAMGIVEMVHRPDGFHLRHAADD